jgi:Ca-activated chloride channel family protein
MIISPIIPIWIMGIIVIILIILVRNKDKKIFFRRLLIIIFLILINLRIMLPSKDAKILTSNLDIFFVIDNTISMVAEDYSGGKPRLEAVKKDCEYIVNELNGANYSIITFNNTSTILTPLTKDSNMTIGAIKTITTMESSYAKGTSMNICLEDLESLLKRAEEKDGRKSIVFFISDGEITNDEKLKSFSSVKKYISDGAVLGYGTEKGGKMKVKDIFGENETYLEDRTSESYPYPKAISKIDEKNLKKIADDMEIEYINMSKQSNIESKIKQIKREANNSLDDSQKMLYNDIYFIFVIPLVLLLASEFIYYKKNV